MYPYKNTLSVPTTPTEATTTSPPTLPYLKNTDLAATIFDTIKDLIANCDDKYAKQGTKFKETIVDQDAKFDTKY